MTDENQKSAIELEVRQGGRALKAAHAFATWVCTTTR